VPKLVENPARVLIRELIVTFANRVCDVAIHTRPHRSPKGQASAIALSRNPQRRIFVVALAAALCEYELWFML
jgi:hypothetical protein